jgi:hypothetical protein
MTFEICTNCGADTVLPKEVRPNGPRYCFHCLTEHN